jgi:hypothetical protein
MANSNAVKIGPGTLYVAKLLTTEPSSISGAWPAGWTQLGYTDAGSQFDYAPTVEAVEVEEEIFPVRYVTTGATGTLTFALAEQTANNLLIALNAGVSSDRVAATTGTSPDITDGSWVEPPALGLEKRIMLGWDALDYNQAGDAFGRLVARQCLQTGSLSIVRRKGNNKATYAAQFTLEKPTGKQPFRAFFPTSLAS